MSTAGLPSILGEGDEAAWKKMLERPNSFLFAVVNAGGDAESLHARHTIRCVGMGDLLRIEVQDSGISEQLQESNRYGRLCCHECR